MPISLGELATQFGCELIGDPDIVVSGVASLPSADSSSLTFLSSDAYKAQLPATKAAVVILRPADADASPVPVLVHEDPYSCYARMASVICPAARYAPEVHASAVVAATASVAASAHLAANVFVGEHSTIGENVYIGPGTVVGPECRVGDDCRLIANVTLARNVSLGVRSTLHPGAVIGGDGFGNAMTPEGWLKVPQLGGVRIGDDVEIGANTTVDCGALDDTVIEDGVRIDNLCMVAHNVHIGAHTAFASMVAIAGSTVIGKRCMFAGLSGAAGHLTVCDDVIINGQGMVSKSIKEPGTYASSFPVEKARDWGRKVARFRRLGVLADRVGKLEDKNS